MRTATRAWPRSDRPCAEAWLRQDGGMTRAKHRKRRPLLTLLLILALFPLAGVAVHRFLPPLATILMVKQAAAGHGMDYRWRSLDRISPRLVEAVIAAEDARFCQHHGFDVEAIQKALEANERAEQNGSGRVRGASTIRQQTAKTVCLWPGRDRETGRVAWRQREQ